jgi:hypothetical protein
MEVGIAGLGSGSQLLGRIGMRLPLLVGPSSAVAGFLWVSRLTSDEQLPRHPRLVDPHLAR